MDKRDRIRGAMIGCAAGDALGYPVKVLSEATIVERYGLRGITDYDLDENGTARITADTQLMLLSANGDPLRSHARSAPRDHGPRVQVFRRFLHGLVPVADNRTCIPKSGGMDQRLPFVVRTARPFSHLHEGL